MKWFNYLNNQKQKKSNNNKLNTMPSLFTPASSSSVFPTGVKYATVWSTIRKDEKNDGEFCSNYSRISPVFGKTFELLIKSSLPIIWKQKYLNFTGYFTQGFGTEHFYFAWASVFLVQYLKLGSDFLNIFLNFFLFILFNCLFS